MDNSFLIPKARKKILEDCNQVADLAQNVTGLTAAMALS